MKYGCEGVPASPVEMYAMFGPWRGVSTLPKLVMMECDSAAGVPVPSARWNADEIRPQRFIGSGAASVVSWQISMASA